ncbi:hypothetical protein [Desulfosporosinus sp.]|uniref:hypothetical protein n=1 Tax=Desulfosporosinus sp. TaxID=157907 RepID=UPI0025BA3A05|nr:hypothetical protein [Desulfosporosinus sp.]MBC2721063.1 hypothetical protein [Desulfosporosinus sp.]MBC2725615.1 hypothetical protein [Desulfosporosinus sp.]
MLTTQSKLTVQALGCGVRGSHQKRHPWRIGGSVHPQAMDGQVSPEPRTAGGDPVHCPGLGSLERKFA